MRNNDAIATPPLAMAESSSSVDLFSPGYYPPLSAAAPRSDNSDR
ncbi:hypothetical protein VB741_07310 [Leptothoe sp. PORK10 BA2]|nr:hypothetical protein [Leptothoe sp. PORK10 BA2]